MGLLSKGLVAGAVISAMVFTVGEAQATPFNTSGPNSLAIAALTSTEGNIDTETLYDITASLYGSGAGSLAPYAGGGILQSVIDFTTPTAASFDFTIAGAGSFDATSVFLISSGTTVAWGVLGTFTIGSDFSNHGQVISASENWSLTQDGGPGSSVSISGTFNTPATISNVPEPGTLALLGGGLLGLFGLGTLRRRRATEV